MPESMRESFPAHYQLEPLTMTTNPNVLDDQFITMEFITHLTGLTDKWFYKLIQESHFPRPIKFGRSSRWLKSEVEGWLNERISHSRH